MGLGQSELVTSGQGAIPVSIRAALPGEARDVVANSQAVGAQRVAGRVDFELGVLPVEWLTRPRRGDFVPVIVALRLAGIDDGEGLGGKAVRG